MKRINSLTIWLVSALSFGALYLSFWALRDLAEPIFGGLAWVFALMVDGAIVVFILAVLRQNLSHQSAKFEWWLVIGSTVVSVALNTAHTAVVREAWIPPVWFYLLLAMIPPIALALSLELLMKQIRSDVTRSEAERTLQEIKNKIQDKKRELVELADAELDKIQPEIANARQELDMVMAELDKAKANKDKVQTELDRVSAEKAVLEDTIAARRFKVIQLVAKGEQQGDIANMLKVSAKTIQRDVEALNGAIERVVNQ